jgi:Na+/H+-dicarboxylate symporter
MKNKKNIHLTARMLSALALGLGMGILMILLREHLTSTGHESTWNTINNIFFADISAEGNEHAIGLFYIIGQIFVKALQCVIVPMVFTSIVLAMVRIKDASRLGRIASRTIGYFFLTTGIAIIIAAIAGMSAYNAGLFANTASGLSAAEGTASSSNPLMILVNAIPSNLTEAFSSNSGVLAIVVSALAIGLACNRLGEKVSIIPHLCEEISSIITVILTWVINTIGPVAIFCLITRTCASYGISYLKPAAVYMILTTAVLLAVLFFGYPLFVRLTTGLKGSTFMKKMGKVALFGFSTSSSAATLPLNMKTVTDELGVDEEISSFVLPLGMTINMDGTAIMQVIAALFIAGCAGYHVTIPSLLVIGVLAVVASIGTPAAPGAGAVILFTILSGMGYTSEMALMTYSLILAINRPIEMLVTSLNVVGDAACSCAVASHENALHREVYNTVEDEKTEAAGLTAPAENTAR